MAGQTLREFLVSINWDMNETKQKSFVAGMRTATLQATLLADALEVVAEKAWHAIAAVAESFDKLNFSAQRTGFTVGSIKDIGYAISQLGGSAAGAQASLEAMAQKLRQNPGSISLLNGIGIGVDKVTGKLEYQHDLLEKLRREPSAEQQQRRERAGEDPLSFLASLNPNFEKYIQQGADARKALGFDADQAAQDSNDFMTAWRETANKLGNIADDLFTKLERALVEPLKQFKAFLDANMPAIGKDIDLIANSLGKVADDWAKSLGEIMDDPARLQKFQDGMKSVAESMATIANKFSEFANDVQSIKWFFDQVSKIAPGPGMLLNGLMPKSPILGGDPTTPYTADAPSDAAGKPQGRLGWAKQKWANRPAILGGTGGKETVTPSGSTGSVGSSAETLTKLIADVSAKEGIDPRIMEGIRAGESGHGSNYDVKDDSIESSWGPFQLNRRRGLGVSFEKDTGLDVRNPATIPAQARWVARYIKEHGGPNGQW